MPGEPEGKALVDAKLKKIAANTKNKETRRVKWKALEDAEMKIYEQVKTKINGKTKTIEKKVTKLVKKGTTVDTDIAKHRVAQRALDTNHIYKYGFDVVISYKKKLKEIDKIPSNTVVFVNSMADTFHNNIEDDILIAFFKKCNKREKDNVVFLLLTKRGYLIKDRVKNLGLKWSKNIWAGSTFGHTDAIKSLNGLKDFKKDNFDNVPSRFLSVEPLLMDVTPKLKEIGLDGISWVICGGESYQRLSRARIIIQLIEREINQGSDEVKRNKPQFRKDNRDRISDELELIIDEVGGVAEAYVHLFPERKIQMRWIRNLRDLCEEKNIPFFMKQYGHDSFNQTLNDKSLSLDPSIKPKTYVDDSMKKGKKNEEKEKGVVIDPKLDNFEEEDADEEVKDYDTSYRKHPYAAKGGCIVDGKFHLANPPMGIEDLPTITLFGKDYYTIDEYEGFVTIWEIKSALPFAKQSVYENLKKDIIKYGITDPLQYFELEDGRKLLIDGQTRFSAAIEINEDNIEEGVVRIPAAKTNKQFKSLQEILEWIVDHQLARRNLAPVERIMSAEIHRERYRKEAKKRQAHEFASQVKVDREETESKGEKYIEPAKPKYQEGKTSEMIARYAGTSSSLVENYDYVILHGTSTVVKEMREQKIAITTASARTRNKIKQDARKASKPANGTDETGSQLPSDIPTPVEYYKVVKGRNAVSKGEIDVLLVIREDEDLDDFKLMSRVKKVGFVKAENTMSDVPDNE